jgi:hypothetical protein
VPVVAVVSVPVVAVVSVPVVAVALSRAGRRLRVRVFMFPPP